MKYFNLLLILIAFAMGCSGEQKDSVNNHDQSDLEKKERLLKELTKMVGGYSVKENGVPYLITERGCEDGYLNYLSLALPTGELLARDVFYRNSYELNEKIDEGGWDLIKVESEVNGDSESVCLNNNQSTIYYFYIRQVHWPLTEEEKEYIVELRMQAARNVELAKE